MNAAPVHRELRPGVAFGGPLQGISAYRGTAWWFFVSYGLTELFADEIHATERSGWGYELTMRTPPSPDPPEWAFGVLVSLARLVQSGRVAFGAGHRLETGHPLAGLPTRLTGVALTLDPELGTVDAPNGTFDFLLVVGVTSDELSRMRLSSTEAVLTELASTTNLVTDPGRVPA